MVEWESDYRPTHNPVFATIPSLAFYRSPPSRFVPVSSSFPAAQIHYAAAILVLFGKLLHVNDLRGHKNGLVSGRIRDGNVDQRFLEVLFAALEAQAAARHVFASHHIVGHAWAAHASLEINARTRMLASIVSIFGGDGWSGSC